MTRQQLVTWLVSNPAVIRANTTVGPDGQPRVPSPGDLAASASQAIELTVANLLTYESVLRSIGARNKTYAVTDTTVPIPVGDGIGEITSVTIGDAKKPLHHFSNPADFNEWLYENVGENADASDEPFGYHLFSQVDTVPQLTIVPGIGDNDSIEVWYLKDYTAPFDVSLFKPTVASILAAGCIEIITTGQFGSNYQDAIGRLAKRHRSGIPEAMPLRHSKEYETHWKKRNQKSSPLF